MLMYFQMTSLMRRHLLIQIRQKFSSSNSRREGSMKSLVHARLQRLRQNQELEKLAKPMDQVESLIAQNMIRENSSEFGSIIRAEERIAAAEEAKKNQVNDPSSVKQVASTSFPYNVEQDDSMFNSKFMSSTEKNISDERIVADKGFFVKGNEYLDDYVAATAADLPEEDMNECPYRFVGNENAIETIEFQLPGQMSTVLGNGKTTKANLQNPDDDEEEEWKANYSTADASITIEVKTNCSGCGAKLHCQDSALPGFVPVEVLKNVVEKEERNARRKAKVDIDELCRRCYMLKHHNFLLNVNVCEVDYERMMGHLKLIQEALILLVVDMTDISGSIYRQLPNIIGSSKPMIVIGNKIDLLPPDSRGGYLRRYRDALNNALNESGLSERFNVMHTALVSAKTGYGIEDLITNIYLKWMNTKGALRSDMYLVGCTNAGKSTLFNSFLQSDLCKVRALDLVERVTTSVWPGTTLSLLKFPLMNPSSHKLELRRRRLLSLRAWAKKEQSAKEMLYSKTKDFQFLTLSGVVDNTFKEDVDAANPVSNRTMNAAISNEVDVLHNDTVEQKAKHGIRLSDVEFTQGHWCFDTPGTVSRDQVLDLYTLDELITLVPRQLIIPKFAVIRPGQSLLFGGTARLDFISSESPKNPVYLTIYCSDRLPLHVKNIEEVEEFLDKFNGTQVVGVPFGDKERLGAFPYLEGKDIHLEKTRNLKAISDIVLSSIGWVTVNSVAEKLCFKALTPQGRGITTRQPLLPFAIEYKGPRIPGTAFYKAKPLITESVEEMKKRQKFQNRR